MTFLFTRHNLIMKLSPRESLLRNKYVYNFNFHQKKVSLVILGLGIRSLCKTKQITRNYMHMYTQDEPMAQSYKTFI